MKHIIKMVYLVILLTATNSIHTAVIVRGNDPDAPYGFKVEIKTQDFDERFGTFYVGLAESGGTYAISSAPRQTFTQPLSFKALVSQDDTTLFDKPIEFMSLSKQELFEAVITAVVETANPFEATTVNALDPSNSANTNQTDPLNDASGTTTTGGIIELQATPDHILVPVRPNAGDFGAAGGGIALIQIDRKETIQPTISIPSLVVLDGLTIKNAVTGFDGNDALPLDATSTSIKSGGNPVVFSAGTDLNEVALHYDSVLDRAYIGMRIITGPAATDIGKAVVLLDIDEENNNALTDRPIVADTALNSSTNSLVAAEGANLPLSILAINTLHATTGPDYLIVNGKEGTTPTVGNQIYALPLVNDPSDRTIHGTLAKKDSALVNGKFVVSAAIPTDVPTATEAAAQVGAGPLPIQATLSPSDIVVVADAVYVSLANDQTTDNDTGVFFSQAEFDSTGRIVQWTPWSRRATPLNAFPEVELPGSIAHDGSIKFFSVDATNGLVWLVENTTQKVVGITSWKDESYEGSLVNVLNRDFVFGSTAVLDLNQSTRGFVDPVLIQGTPQRYALFGGLGKVAFARVSEATITATAPTPQTVMTDFTNDENYFLSSVPTRNCITTLEYSRRTFAQGAENYFFAGSADGLFVYTDSGGNGFIVNTLSTVDQSPIAGGIWQHIPIIEGAVIDIKTTGNGNLYIITAENGTDPILSSTVYSIPFASDIATMFAPGNIRIIAETGVAPFTKAYQFYGMQIVATDDPGGANPADKEQLILTTSQGLYYSNASQLAAATGIPQAVDQTTANWTLVTDTQAVLFNGIAGMETPIKHTVWPFNLVDASFNKTYEQGSVSQLSVTGNSTGTAVDIGEFVPSNFISDSTEKKLLTINPVNFFYSDGGRRFFTLNGPTFPGPVNKLFVIPYFVQAWDVQSIQPLLYEALLQVEHFNWQSMIGATGLLLAGTNQGIVSLE